MGERISINKLCRRCMNELKNEDAKCAVCGFDKTEYNVPREHLRVDCILKGKYLVGVCIRETEYEKSYVGWNLGYDTKVVIKEFFPKSIVEREDHDSGKVVEKKPNYQEIFGNNLTKFINQAELVAFSDGKKINITETFQENGTAYYVVSCFETDPGLGMKELDIIAGYEVLKPSMYESPLNDNDGIPSEFRRAGSGLGRGYVQPAYHVQPARGNSSYTGEEKSTKNIASNVLQGASVSYVKIMRPKSESLNMDMEELEHSRNEESKSLNESNYNDIKTFSNSIVSTDGSHVQDSVQGEPDQIDDNNLIGKIRRFFDQNRTSTAIAFVIVLFLIVGVRAFNQKKRNNEANADKTVEATKAVETKSSNEATPTAKADNKTDNKKDNKEDNKEDNKADNKGDDKLFKFSDPNGAFAAGVAQVLGKDVESVTVADVEGLTELNLKGKGLTDITDIEKFTSLKSLDISQNELTDISAVNSLSNTLEYLNLAGNSELVEQVPDIIFVAGRKNKNVVKFIYVRDDADYSDVALWVWTKDPGWQVDFEEKDGEAYAAIEGLFATDRRVGFKLKTADTSSFIALVDDVMTDREFLMPCNQEGAVVTVIIQQGVETYDVSYKVEKDD